MSGAWLVLFIGLWLVCIVLSLLVVGLSRRIEVIEGRAGPDSTPGAQDLRERLVGREFATGVVESGIVSRGGDLSGVWVFVSEHCGPCQLLASEIARTLNGGRSMGLAAAIGSRVTIVTDQAGVFDALGATDVVIDPEGALMSRFDVHATPTGIALDARGVVTEARIANRFHHLDELARAVQGGTSSLGVAWSA